MPGIKKVDLGIRQITLECLPTGCGEGWVILQANVSKPQAKIVVPRMMRAVTIAVMVTVLLVGAVIWQASFWQGFSDIAQQLVATQGQANQYFEAGREMARRLNKPAA